MVNVNKVIDTMNNIIDSNNISEIESHKYDDEIVNGAHVLSDYDLYSKRKTYCVERCWTIITPKLIEEMVNFIGNRKVVEIMAGTGYLSGLLKQHMDDNGINSDNITAYDDMSWYKSKTVGKLWSYKGKVVVTPYEGIPDISSADIVLLTWPPYKDTTCLEYLKQMKSGQILIYNGEGYGGCTGTDEMYDLLEDQFDPYDPTSYGVYEPFSTVTKVWSGIHDSWYIYVKK